MACVQSEEDARRSWMQWCVEHVQAALAAAGINQGDDMRRRNIAQEICDDAWASAAYRRRLAMRKHLQQVVREAAHQLNIQELDQTSTDNMFSTSRSTTRQVSGTSTPTPSITSSTDCGQSTAVLHAKIDPLSQV